MQVFDISYAKIVWGGCADERPWLVIRVYPNDKFGCFPISGQCYSGQCFYIDQQHPDFSATGLTKSCFIHDASIIEIASNQFTRFKGALTNQLLAEFREYAGI